MSSLLPGFLLGFSLILAIGAQNAFVLRQGILRQHVFWVCFTCALSDALLIALGVSGMGLLAERFPGLVPAMRLGGALFLLAYGSFSLCRALKSDGRLDAESSKTTSLKQTILICLAFTWLNPHVYLDTMGLVGTLSTQYPAPAVFGLGAAVASFVFFFSLGYGARLLGPVFKRARAWQVLDLIIALVMFALAASLLLH